VKIQSTMLLTGGTGFLGSALMTRLLQEHRYEKVFILIRDTASQSAPDRLKSLLRKMFAPELLPLATQKFIAIAGDLEQADIGISDEDRARLIRECTHVCHVGASTDFSLPLEESRRVNVEGTQKILSLVCDMIGSNPQFVRLDYVSTAFVAGTKRGRVSEDVLSRHQGFANSYEQSKFEAEELVRRYQLDLPIAIHRPSIVVGDSRNGFTPHFKVLYWPLFLLSKNILPFIPCNQRAKLDVVPVDYVADSMMALMADADTIGKTWYQTCGESNMISIAEFLNDAFRMTGIESKPLIPIGIFLFLARMFKRFLPKEAWQACEMAAVYTAYIRGTKVKFDDQTSKQKLRALGVQEVPHWSSYKGQIFKYCVESRWGKKKLSNEFLLRSPEQASGCAVA
jgi:long-chain acyl-CoA synthetase